MDNGIPLHVAAAPVLQPEPAQLPPPAVPVPAPMPVQPDAPWDVLFPRFSVYRNAIVRNALPHLLALLRIPENRLKPKRDLVNTALDHCRDAGNTFWGQYDVYTRRRSACDAILCHYFDTLHDFVSGRRPVVM